MLALAPNRKLASSSLPQGKPRKQTAKNEQRTAPGAQRSFTDGELFIAVGLLLLPACAATEQPAHLCRLSAQILKLTAPTRTADTAPAATECHVCAIYGPGAGAV